MYERPMVKGETHRLQPVQIIPSPVSFTDHVRQLQILGLDIPLHSLHLVNRLLSGISFQLETLALVQKIEMFASQLRVKFGESVILVLPYFDLLLELHDQFILRGHLQVDVLADH